MENFSCDGFVIREQYTGEADRIITVLTKDYGVIRAFAKGARRPKSKLYSGTAFLVYSHFVFFEKNDVYRVTEATVLNVFPNLEKELDRIAVVNHFCELIMELISHHQESSEALRLLLNTVYFLDKEVNAWYLKPLFQLRILSLTGFTPNIIACNNCGTFETETMYFDIEGGTLYCSECAKHGRACSVDLINTIRDIVIPTLEKAYQYKVSAENIGELNQLCDEYLTVCTERKYKTLDFLRPL